MQRGTDYKVVAVIGCQSSGKSTLMNLLFDTHFEIMDESLGRQQTTKGIWISHNTEGNLIILDIEGTDSKERGEQRMVGKFKVLFQINSNSRFFVIDIRVNNFTFRSRNGWCPSD